MYQLEDYIKNIKYLRLKNMTNRNIFKKAKILKRNFTKDRQRGRETDGEKGRDINSQ